ncbi:MAG: response regulator [Gemmatimonadales bacterium]|nr:MAG: response regulator [Gemmatimonadales bacterium]
MTTATLRVLLVEDQEEDALMTRALLQNLPDTRTDVEWAPTPAGGLGALLERRHDVCLLDYHMGEETGLDVLKRARSQAVRTPVILLTGKGSRRVDLEAMRAGAVDYLQKGAIDPEALERALRYAVERHRAQEELRSSEERNRGMFDHLPLGLFRVTMDGEYLEANPALIRILENPDRTTLGDRLARHCFVGERDHPRLLRTLEEKGEVTGFESMVQSGSGRTLRLRVSARVHRGSLGSAEYIEGTVEDLTGSASEHEMEEDAGCFRTLSAITPSALLRADPDGQIRWANQVALDQLGEDLDGLVASGLWTVVHPSDQDRVARAFEEIAGGSRDRCVREVRIIREDGSDEVQKLTLAAVTGRGGSLQSVLAMLAPGG